MRESLVRDGRSRGPTARRRAWVAAVTGVALCIGSGGLLAQQEPHRLTGRVIDKEGGEPVPAASILVTGTTIGTVTSDSGTFSVRLPADATTLTVRRIGFLSATVPVTTDMSDVSVALNRDVLKLEQEVITGVATTVESRNAANDVAVLNAQAVSQVPAPTVENALQGKIPGADIRENNGGAPGGGIQVQIRGVTSINANASPLYVIDGISLNNETINSGLNAVTQAGGPPTLPTSAPSPEDQTANRIADLNPEDIESIQVLKGASASAIYGSKASSGVIIITTKRGAAGKPQWQFSQKVGHFSSANSYDLQTFPTLASAEAWGDKVGKPKSLIDAVYAGPQDYQSQLFSNPQASYESDLSVGGTINQTQFYVSALSKYDNGTMTNTGYNKQSARVNITQQFNSALSGSLNLMYGHSVARRGVTANENIGIAPTDVLTYTPSFVKLDGRNADGSWATNPFGNANPFADAAEIQTPEDVGRFIGGGSIDWSPFTAEHQSLKIRFIGGVDVANQRDQFYAPPDLQVERLIPTGLPGTATVQDANAQYLNYSINLIHNFNTATFDATTSLGFVRERRSNNAPDVIAQSTIAGVNTPTAGQVTTVFYNRNEARDQSLYAQEQLLLLGQRLAVTAGLTGERSTTDGSIDKFFIYPRYSASYRVPQFVGFLDELKLRAAYGQAGTQPNYGVKYTPYTLSIVGGNIGVVPNLLLGDSLISPERETEIETGFDATLFNRRAEFTLTLYQKRVQNLLLQASVAPSQYFNQEWINGGVFTNQGIELGLQVTPISTRSGFSWNSGVTYYRNYSKVNSIPVPAFPDGNTFGALFGNGYVIPGRSISELVDPSIAGSDGQPVQVGDFQPGFIMSFAQTFTYKNLRLYGLVDYHRGGTVIDITEFLFDFTGGFLADTAGARTRSAAYLTGNIRPYLEPGTFVKLREVTASYTLPDRFTQWLDRRGGIRFSSVKLALTGRNLLSSFPYHGLDPEVNAWGSQNVTIGQDVYPYPPSRSFFVSLGLGF